MAFGAVCHRVHVEKSHQQPGHKTAHVKQRRSSVTTNTASSYSGIIMDIVDYKDPNKYTTLRSLSGMDLNGSNTWINMFSGLWFNTAAITNITLTISGATFAANSHFALYGVS